MPIIFDGPVEPDALVEFVRAVPTPDTLSLTAMFGRRDVDDNSVDFAEIVRTNRTARFRSYDGRIHVSQRDAGSESKVKLLPLSSSLSMGEYERLQLEFARTAGTNEQALARAVYNDAENLTREVQNRMELAWGDVLADGKLTINENDFQGEADFGVPANHKVTAATAWTDTVNATVLSDLVSWSDTYNQTNGFRPSTMQTSLKYVRNMQKNAEIINAIRGAAAQVSRVTMTELNDLLASEGLPTLRAPYDTQVDVDGVSTRVTPENTLQFFPPNPEQTFFTTWGVTATALELVNSSVSDLSFEDAPGIVGVIEKVGPPYRQFTFVDAVGMPILASGKRLLIATVGA